MGIYLVMKNNFKRSLHHKSIFIVTFLIPIILCIIMGSIEFGKSTLRIGLIGLEESSITESEKTIIYEILDNSDGIKYNNAKEEVMKTDLITGKYHLILDYKASVIMEDFELISNLKEEQKYFLKETIHSAFTQNQKILLTDMKPKGLSVTQRSITILVSLFMIFATIHAARMIRDRQNSILLRYQFAHQRGIGYITGYFIYNLLITYIQVLVCMAVLLLIQKDFALSLAAGAYISLAIAIISTIFSMIICLGSKSEVQANILASALASVFSLLGGTFVAVETMPGMLRVLSYASPVRWMVELLGIV